MGEFHMQSGRFPPVLYAAHIEYPDGDYYQGVGVPGLAFLAAGRTPSVGWSYTYGHADNIDILVEKCEQGRYRAAGELRPLTNASSRSASAVNASPNRGSTLRMNTGRPSPTFPATACIPSCVGPGSASRLPI